MNAIAQTKTHWRLTLRRLRHRLKLSAASLLSGRPFQPLFILATGRSGSTLLLDYLRSLPGVNLYSEILEVNTPIGLKPSECCPDAALRHVSRSLQSLRTPIRGCKMMFFQLSRCGLSANDLRAAFPAAKYLIIYRQSLVEQYLSEQVARATGQWMVRRGDTPKQARVTVDPVELAGFSAQTQWHYQRLLSHGWLRQKAVLLSYEELVADPEGWIAGQICPLLGLPPAQPQTRLVKQNRQTLAERVVNYEAVAEVLNDPRHLQRYAWNHDPAARAA
jgi:LPS sulfotransferase NodH